MGIISMLFLFVKQSAFICLTFIKDSSGRGRNGCTKFLPRLFSYAPRHSPHAQSGNVLLSQVFPHVLDPPLAAHMGEPNQVHSLTSSETTGEMDVTDAQRKSPRHRLRLFFVESGNVLLSQVVSNQVPSALKGLTSVFGMGTGGSLSPLSPENCEGFVQSFVFLVSAPSLHNRSFHLGDFPHISRFIFYCAYPENRTSRSLFIS